MILSLSLSLYIYIYIYTVFNQFTKHVLDLNGKDPNKHHQESHAIQKLA